MRKILFIGLVMLLLGSCSVESDNITDGFYFEYVPIETVDMPAEFELGQTYEIEYMYYRPSTCHVFNDLYNLPGMNQYTIAVIKTVYPESIEPCEDLELEVITRTFNFNVTSSSTYHFRFWQGTDSNNQDLYLEIEVPVN